MRKLIFSWIFLSFCISQIWAMQDDRETRLTPLQLKGANCAAMRLVGDHDAKKELMARVSVPCMIISEVGISITIPDNPTSGNECVSVRTNTVHKQTGNTVTISSNNVVFLENITDGFSRELRGHPYAMSASYGEDDLLFSEGWCQVARWDLSKLRTMQNFFKNIKEGVLPIKTFIQKNTADNARTINVDPKVLLLLMHKLNIAFRYYNKNERYALACIKERNALADEEIKSLSLDGRAVLTPQELAYLTKVIFESGEDVRDAVKNFVAVAKKHQK